MEPVGEVSGYSHLSQKMTLVREGEVFRTYRYSTMKKMLLNVQNTNLELSGPFQNQTGVRRIPLGKPSLTLYESPAEDHAVHKGLNSVAYAKTHKERKQKHKTQSCIE